MSAKESEFSHLLNTRVVPRLSQLSLTVSVLVFIAVAAFAQSVPSWVGHLLLGNSTITADPTLTAPEAQGLGQKFELVFSMVNAQDPQNVDNDVIALNTGAFPSNVIGVAVRNMLPKAKIETLTNQISLKYYFVFPRTCSGGSPRIQLFVDPGNGTTPPANAFGYPGNAAFGAGCISDNNWHFQDMANLSDPVPRWELSGQWVAFGSPAFCTGGDPFTCTWPQVVRFFDTVFPNHAVLNGGVFEDSCSFALLACGQAYYLNPS